MQPEKADRGMSIMNRGSNLRPADIEDFNNGLRILARMIAKAYLKDLALKHQQLKREEAVAETTPSNTKLIKIIPKGRLALTVPEAAKLLGVDRTSFYDSIANTKCQDWSKDRHP